MDIAAINRLLNRYHKFSSQEKKEFRLLAGLSEIPGFVPPPKIVKPKPYKKHIPANSTMNTHFNTLSFEERKKFIQEMSTEKLKKKHG